MIPKRFKITFYQHEDGRWFCMAKKYKDEDREEDIFDEHHNNIECFLDTPIQGAECIIKNLEEVSE